MLERFVNILNKLVMLSLLVMFLLIRGAYYLIYRAIIKIIREIKKSKTAAPLIHRQPYSRAVDTPKAARIAAPTIHRVLQPDYSQPATNRYQAPTKLLPTLSDPQLRYCMRNYEAPAVLRADEGCPNSSTPNPPSTRT